MKFLHELRPSSLTHVEAGQLIKSNLTDLVTASIGTTADIHINNYVTQMEDDSELFDKALLQTQKNEETDVLLELDRTRDGSISIFSRQLKVYELSNVPAETAAYRSLKIVFAKYKDMAAMNYAAETNAIANLLQDLSESQNADHVETLNLTNYVERLRTDNDQFNAKFSNRSTEIAATVTYNAKAIRKTMIQNYSNYANYVLSMAIAADTPFYNSILNIINYNRKYYSDLLARRQGTAVVDPASN